MGLGKTLGAIGGAMSLPFVASTGLALGGSALDYLSAQKQNKSAETMAKDSMAFSASEASRQMAFQERMSGTAHQREVEDLKKAGLNPLLSVNSGASTPGGASGTGAMAPVVPEFSGVGDDVRENAMSVIAAKGAMASARSADASAREMTAKAGLSEMELKYAKSNPSIYFSAKMGPWDTFSARMFDRLRDIGGGLEDRWKKFRVPFGKEDLRGPRERGGR